MPPKKKNQPQQQTPPTTTSSSTNRTQGNKVISGALPPPNPNHPQTHVPQPQLTPQQQQLQAFQEARLMNNYLTLAHEYQECLASQIDYNTENHERDDLRADIGAADLDLPMDESELLTFRKHYHPPQRSGEDDDIDGFVDKETAAAYDGPPGAISIEDLMRGFDMNAGQQVDPKLTKQIPTKPSKIQIKLKPKPQDKNDDDNNNIDIKQCPGDLTQTELSFDDIALTIEEKVKNDETQNQQSSKPRLLTIPDGILDPPRKITKPKPVDPFKD